MRKRITTKKIAIILSAVLLVTAALFVTLIFNNNNDDEVFRSIMIYELNGNALIERASGGTIDAIENIYLESGDLVRVSADSMMRLKLDNDKYIVAEANSIFTLVAEGDEKDSLTRINLERGAITNEIQNPLSKKSMYETSTPNSVMAVRGTIYRVELCDNGNGELDTRMCCFQGIVATTPVLPDGSTGEEVLVHAGKEVTVYKDGAATEPDYIDFATLPSQAITVLGDLNVDMTQHKPADTDFAADEGSGQDLREAFNNIGVKDDNEQAGGNIVDGGIIIDGNIIIGRTDTNTDAEAVNDSENTAANEEKPLSNDDRTLDDRGSDDSADTSGGGNTDDRGSDDSTDTSGGGNTDNPEPGHKPDDRPVRPPEPKVYTVTFKYGDSVFATQSVMQGGKVQKPTLKPAKTGSWDFDFDGTTIKGDTTIVWIDG